MNHLSHRQMSESFLTAAFLSISGGLQDAYTYLFRGKVFANAQTGNIVLLSACVVDRNWYQAAHYLIPLLFFALGIAAAEWVRLKYQRIERLHWRQLVVLSEIILLFAVGFFPVRLNLFANALVSFSCAMQVQTFRKVNGYAFASTMCIGNLRSCMESLCVYARTRDKWPSCESTSSDSCTRSLPVRCGRVRRTACFTRQQHWLVGGNFRCTLACRHARYTACP